ncbi:MAG: UDP-N-acetylglucosamine 2-epimerase (non-hydrolyzing) [Actinomycetota bacterium]|nr:UDP-N-acetylglucosamine 2-epimerase (non-hydrolyzing) [Actinomycetota bacterium]
MDRRMWAARRKPVVALICGTRPEAIKLAPVATALAASGWAQPVLAATGQHGDVVHEVLDLFGLHADHAVPAAVRTESVAELSARMLGELDALLSHVEADLVIVQGDTASTLAGAMAGFFRRVPVAHVEAGLRTGDLDAPFPEEGNRRLVSQVTALHLAPTAGARANLLADGIAADKIVITGNTVIDALLAARAAACPYDDPQLEAIDAAGRPLVVVTAHRRESWGAPIGRIGHAVRRLAALHPDCDFVVAAHMNPAVREVLEPALRSCRNVYLPGPVAYGPFARLIGRASLLVTDSGGIQEEASALGLPVLVTRDTTERTESLDHGVARLVGTDEATIVSAATRLLKDPQAYADMARVVHPYGDGFAAERVVAACAWLLGHGLRPSDFVAPEFSASPSPVPMIRKVPA